MTEETGTQSVTFNSTAIKSATWHESGLLTVTFVKGSTSTVENVGLQEWKEFCNSESAGRFWNEHFKKGR
jgi:hypothetical protein